MQIFAPSHMLICTLVFGMHFNKEVQKPTGSNHSIVMPNTPPFIRIYFKIEHHRKCQLHFADKRTIKGYSLKRWLYALMISVIKWIFSPFIQSNPVTKFLIVLPTSWNQGESRKLNAELPNKPQIFFWFFQLEVKLNKILN